MVLVIFTVLVIGTFGIFDLSVAMGKGIVNSQSKCNSSKAVAFSVRKELHLV